MSIFLAEKERFEPSKRFWRLHDFQSCALDQTRRLLQNNISWDFPTHVIIYDFVKKYKQNYTISKIDKICVFLLFRIGCVVVGLCFFIKLCVVEFNILERLIFLFEIKCCWIDFWFCVWTGKIDTFIRKIGCRNAQFQLIGYPTAYLKIGKKSYYKIWQRLLIFFWD